MRGKLIAGNWKMNGLKASHAELDRIVAGAAAVAGHVELLIAPPFTLIDSFARATAGSRVAIGAQDVHAQPAGAHTGCVSAPMLADAGATHVIVGHSERRSDCGETDADVRAKTEAALAHGLIAIVCVGETEAERDLGRALDVVGRQLAGSLPATAAAGALAVAYEPVWAIGTGRTPSVADVAEVHAFIRDCLRERLGAAGDGIRILYGGSVKPSNAVELLSVANVDGALVGGASLTAAQFLPIALAA